MLTIPEKENCGLKEQGMAIMIDALTDKGKRALEALPKKSQKETSHIVHQMSLAAVDQHMVPVKLAHGEVGRGIYEDKAVKNLYVSEYIWNSIKDNKTAGIIGEDREKGLTYAAELISVVYGVMPVTNPMSTTIFKAMITIKTGNSIIFAFHPSAQESPKRTAEVVLEAAMKAGTSRDIIQWIEVPSIETTKQLMNHKGIASVLATGGPGMVKFAYSTGKLALGVGPGSMSSYIKKVARTKHVINDIIGSKTFDNGAIRASKQVVVIDKEIYKDATNEFKVHQAYLVKRDEL